ncbi:Uncharacterised protein [Yersinia mollaretii]|uniref:hypothetical protein n=2 Tax=Yersiniaceae TaxID=1903411 RepID=UPI0005DDCAEC|nr:hypothetical protein [Yersinia mollaretii]CQR12688.1 Uncharacterised protein [Yersinia mollaretii]
MPSYDYLVVGGERHGEVFDWEFYRGEIKLPNKKQPIAKFYAKDAVAPVYQPIEQKYDVLIYIADSGNEYLLATLGDITEYDIEKLIAECKPSPYKLAAV